MTGLFDRIKNTKFTLVKPEMAQEVHNVELPQNTLSSAMPLVPQDTQYEGAKEVNQEPTEIIPSLMQKSSQNAGFVDLGETDDIQFGGEKSSTDAILEMAGDGNDFAVKGVVRSPNAFTAAQVQANYNESLGFGAVAEILRKCCEWQYKHNSSDKGERAKLIFGALGTAKQEEFQLEKETKGLLGNK